MKKFLNGNMYFLWCYEPSEGHDKIYGVFHKHSGENYACSGKRGKSLRMDIKPKGDNVLGKLLDDKTCRPKSPYRETSEPKVIDQIEEHFKSLGLVEEVPKKIIEWFGVQKVKSKVEFEGFEKGVIYQVIGVVEKNGSDQTLKIENRFGEEVILTNPDDMFEPVT